MKHESGVIEEDPAHDPMFMKSFRHSNEKP